MPFQWRQGRVSPTPDKQPGFDKSRKPRNRGLRSCFPRIHIGERHSLTKLWNRYRCPRRRPRTKNRALSDEKALTGNPRLLVPFQKAGNTCGCGGDTEEKRLPIPAVTGSNATLKASTGPSQQLAVLVETYLPQNTPDEELADVEHSRNDCLRPCPTTELLSAQTEHRASPCPPERQKISPINRPTPEKCCSVDQIITEQRSRDWRGSVDSENTEDQKTEAQDPEESGEPREIVVIFSWDSKEKRVKKRQVRSPIHKNTFFSPPGASGSCDSTPSSSGYSASGSSVRRGEKLSSARPCRSTAGRGEGRSSSGGPSVEYWPGGRRRSWSLASDTDHADESEVCSCSSVASSRLLSPPQSVYSPPCTQNDETSTRYTSTGDQNGREQSDGESHRIGAGIQGLTSVKKGKQDIPSPLAQGCPLLLQQDQHRGPSRQETQEVPSTSRWRKPYSDTGACSRFEEGACNKSATPRNIQNACSKALDGHVESRRDARPGGLQASILPSVPSASTTSTYRTLQRVPSPCVGITQDTTSTAILQATSSLPACFRTNTTSLFPFSRTDSTTGLHHRHPHSARPCCQASRFSAAAKSSCAALRSTSLYKTRRGRSTASRHKERGCPQYPLAGLSAPGQHMQAKNKAHFLFPCTAYFAESWKSGLQALPLISTVIKVSHAVVAAAHRRSCATLDGPNVRRVGTSLIARGGILPPTQELSREDAVGTGSRVITGHQLSAVKSSSIICSSIIPALYKRTHGTTTVNGMQEKGEVNGVHASGVAACLTFHSSSLPLTCDTADSGLLSSSPLCTLASLPDVKRGKEGRKRKKCGQNPEQSVKCRVPEPRPQQQGQQRQRELARFFDPRSLSASDASRASHEEVYKAHHSSSTTAAGAVLECATHQVAAALKDESLPVLAKKFLSSIPSIREPLPARAPPDMQEHTQVASPARALAASVSDSASMSSSLRSVGPAHPSSSASGNGVSSSSPTHFQQRELSQSSSAVQGTRSACAEGEVRASRVDGTSRSESGEAGVPIKACHIVAAYISLDKNITDDRRSEVAEEATSKEGRKGMVTSWSPGHCMHAECTGRRLQTDEGGILTPASQPRQQTGTLLVISPTESAAVTSRASGSGLAVQSKGGAGATSSEESLNVKIDSLCPCLQNPSCAGGPTIEQNGGERANLPCVSSPVRQLLTNRPSPVPQDGAGEEAAAPSASADFICPAVRFAEGVIDGTSSLEPREGNEQLHARQKAHTLWPVTSVELNLQKTTSKPFPSTEFLSHTENVLSAVGLGFTSFVELGATALRNLFSVHSEEEIVSSHTETNADKAGGGGVSSLSSKASSICVPRSPSTTIMPQARGTVEPPERPQQASNQLNDDGDKRTATEVLSCAAPRCGTFILTLVQSETPTLTTASEGSTDTSVTSAATNVEVKPSTVQSIAGDIRASPPTLSRFHSASCCSAVTPAPAAFGSSFLPGSCCSTPSVDCSNRSAALPSCVPGKSQTFDSAVDSRAVAPRPERTDQNCRSCSLSRSPELPYDAAVSRIGWSATAGQTDTLHSAPRGSAAAPINLTPSHVSITGRPATSLTDSSSVHFPGSTGSRVADNPMIGQVPCSGGNDSRQTGKRIFCCRRGSTADKSGCPGEKNSVASSNGDPPSTCSRSRSLSELIQTRSRFSIVVLLRCLRPFTTKWGDSKQEFDTCGSLGCGGTSFENACSPVTHQPRKIDQPTVQDRHRAMSGEECLRKSDTENKSTNVTHHAEVATEQKQGAEGGRDISGVEPGRSLCRLMKAPASCLVFQPEEASGPAEKTQAMTGKSASTAALAGRTRVAPAGTYKCEERVRPSCLVSSSPPPTSFTTSRKLIPQCTSRRIGVSPVHRGRTRTSGRLALSPTFPPVLIDDLSTSWPQGGAQSPQQQHMGQSSPKEIQGERQETPRQLARTHETLFRKEPNRSEVGQGGRPAQRNGTQDLQQHSKLPIDKQQLEKSHIEISEVREAHLREEQHAKRHTEKEQCEGAHSQLKKNWDAHQRSCLLQTAVTLQCLPARLSQLETDRSQPKAQEGSCSHPAGSTALTLSDYQPDSSARSDVKCPSDAAINRLPRRVSGLLFPLSIAPRKQEPHADNTCPNSLGEKTLCPLHTENFMADASAGTRPVSSLPSIIVLQSPPRQPAGSDCFAVPHSAPSFPQALHADVSRITPLRARLVPAAVPPAPRLCSSAFPVTRTANLRNNTHFSSFPPLLHRVGPLLLPQQLQQNDRITAQYTSCNRQSTGLQKSVQQRECGQSCSGHTDTSNYMCPTSRPACDNKKSLEQRRPCGVLHTGGAHSHQQADLSPGLFSRSEVARSEVRAYTATLGANAAGALIEQHAKMGFHYSSVQALPSFHNSHRLY